MLTMPMAVAIAGVSLVVATSIKYTYKYALIRQHRKLQEKAIKESVEQHREYIQQRVRETLDKKLGGIDSGKK